MKWIFKSFIYSHFDADCFGFLLSSTGFVSAMRTCKVANGSASIINSKIGHKAKIFFLPVSIYSSSFLFYFYRRVELSKPTNFYSFSLYVCSFTYPITLISEFCRNVLFQQSVFCRLQKHVFRISSIAPQSPLYTGQSSRHVAPP
jgi:hypothetical protein